MSEEIIDTNDKVLCFDQNYFYEGRCVYTRSTDSEREYFIYYTGRGLYEWVPQARVRKFDDENLMSVKSLLCPNLKLNLETQSNKQYYVSCDSNIPVILDGVYNKDYDYAINEEHAAHSNALKIIDAAIVKNESVDIENNQNKVVSNQLENSSSHECDGSLTEPEDNKTVSADIYDVRNSRNFTGKVVLVTGSSSGIGETTAKLFSSLGASVVITGRNETNIKRVAEEAKKLSPFGLKPLELVADLTKKEDLIHLVNETITKFGQLDVLVNNAGAGAFTTISDANILNEFDNIISINVRPPLYLSHLSVPYLQKTKGTIINISSDTGLHPSVGLLVYCMAKSSLDMMTKVLAVELGSFGIRVNTINSGVIDETNFGRDAGSPILRDKVIGMTPLTRVAEPIDVAKLIAFLASSDAQYITGANIVVDGGSIYNMPANFMNSLS